MEQKASDTLDSRAQAAWEAKNWKAAQPLFAELAAKQSSDVGVLMKAGGAFSFSFPVDMKVLKQGEGYLNDGIKLRPRLGNLYCILARNLIKQNRHGEALAAVKKMLADCEPMVDPQGKALSDAMAVAGEALAHAHQSAQFGDLVKQAKQKYPDHVADLDKSLVEQAGRQAWEEGQVWLKAPPPKDFHAGEAIFKRLYAARPQDYWANLLLGSVYTWNKKEHKFTTGETYVRTALQMNPDLPNAYHILSMNLMNQGRGPEAVSVVEQMMSRRFEDIDTNPDKADKIVAAVSFVAQILGKADRRYAAVQASAAKQYPFLASRLN